MKVKVKLIRNIRKARGFSQEEIAHLLNISQSQYSKLENGEIAFNVTQLGILCDKLDLNPLNIIEFTEKQLAFIGQHNVINTNKENVNEKSTDNEELIRKIVSEVLSKLK